MFGTSLVLAADISETVCYAPIGATFIDIAPNGANIDAGGEGTISNNKVIDLGGAIAINGYDTFELEWAVILNTINIRDSDRFTPNGWAFYQDGSGVNIVAGGTPVRLTIDGAGSATEESFLPRSIRGISSLWSNDTLTGITEGDAYDIRVQFVIVCLLYTSPSPRD